MMFSSVMASPDDLAADLALADDDHPIAHTDQLRQFGRDDDDADAVARQIPQDGVDLGLGSDIDAARRLVQEDHLRVDRQQLGEGDLLLVAPGQRRDVLVQVAELESSSRPVRSASCRSRRRLMMPKRETWRSDIAEMFAAIDMSRNTPSALRSSDR